MPFAKYMTGTGTAFHVNHVSGGVYATGERLRPVSVQFSSETNRLARQRSNFQNPYP